MNRPPILCPTCQVPPDPGTTVCPQCHEDLAALMQLVSLSAIYYNQAVQMAERGELDKAIARLHLALDREPARVEPLDLLGDLYARQNHWREAKTHWQRALQIDPDDAAARQGLARAEEAGQRQAQAEARQSRIRWVALAVAFLVGLAAGLVVPVVRVSQEAPRPAAAALAAATIPPLVAPSTVVPTSEPTRSPVPIPSPMPESTRPAAPSPAPSPTLAPSATETPPIPAPTLSPWLSLGQMRVGCNSQIDFAPVVARRFRFQMLAGGGGDGLISFACCSSKGSSWWVNGAWIPVTDESPGLQVGDIRETEEFSATVVSRMRFDLGCNDGEAMDAAIWYLGKK